MKLPEPINVALTSEEDRYQTIFKALDILTHEINDKIDKLDEKNDYILIKPNCVCADNQLSATHLDALKVVVHFVSSLWSGRIIVAENTALGNTFEAFENYKYDTLKPEFPRLEFLDLSYADSVFVDIVDKDLKPVTIKIANTVANAPFRISVGPAKTHDTVIVTLSIKNMAIGAISKEDREAHLSHDYRAMNKSIAMLNEFTQPHLAVIDGWESMEGDGPAGGTPVQSKFCVASMNAIAADCIATEIMGFNPLQVGYLNYLGANEIRGKIKVAGRDLNSFHYHFKPHKNYLKQLEWTC